MSKVQVSLDGREINFSSLFNERGATVLISRDNLEQFVYSEFETREEFVEWLFGEDFTVVRNWDKASENGDYTCRAYRDQNDDWNIIQDKV